MKAHRKVLSILAMALAVAFAFFIVPAVTDSGERASAHWPYTLIYYDGHMHTTRSDGTGEVPDIKATALARGLSAVIITDHCKDVTLAEWNSLVAETAAVSDGSFLALPGVEITGSEGMVNRDHFNAWNISDPFVGDDTLELCPEEVWESPENPAGTGGNDASMTAWADYVHEQGGIINHNHTTGHTKPEYGVDNVEIYNQGHVDDIMGYALQLGYPLQQAWEFAMLINNFAIYGERDLMTIVPFPGIDEDGDQHEDGTRGLPFYQCYDGLDNDDDGTCDMAGCNMSADTDCGEDPTADEGGGANSCDNGLDDDNDGECDASGCSMPADAHCQAGPGIDEDPLDGADNDGDGQIDEDSPYWPLRYALYWATKLLSGVGQVMGWSDPPDPSLPGDLTSWDELLMAYVDGTLDKPTFGVANSDAHNTKWTDDPLESNVGTAKNGLYVTRLTPRQVYKAIEAGRSFATTGPSLAFDVNGRLMGGTAYVWSGGSANVNLSVKAETPGFILGEIDIIKNGEVVQTISPMAPTYDGTLVYSVTERGYYRVEVTSVDLATGAYRFAWSNPVFVKCPFDDDCDGYLNFIERILGSDPDDAGSTPEHWLIRGTCRDGLDNDKDGLTDSDDPSCP